MSDKKYNVDSIDEGINLLTQASKDLKLCYYHYKSTSMRLYYDDLSSQSVQNLSYLLQIIEKYLEKMSIVTEEYKKSIEQLKKANDDFVDNSQKGKMIKEVLYTITTGR